MDNLIIFSDFHRQYRAQKDLLIQLGFISKNSGVLSTNCYDGTSSPIPSFETVMKRCFQDAAFLESKITQGFTKLLLVPFGMSLDRMFFELDRYLFLKRSSIKPCNAHEKLLNDAGCISIWKDWYCNADSNGTLVYDPQEYSEVHGGKTKSQLLLEREGAHDAHAGWRIILLQAGANGCGITPILRKDDIKRARYPSHAHESPRAYLQLHHQSRTNPQSPGYREFGIAPEEWIMAFVTHLAETGMPLDAYEDEPYSAAFLTGGYFTKFSDCIPSAYWSCEDSRVEFVGRHPDNAFCDVGFRSAVRL